MPRSTYRGKIVYIEGPKYRKTGQVLHGYKYGCNWIEGYAGPFHYDGPQFGQIMAKLPGRCSIITQDQYYGTEAGIKELRKREAMLAGKTLEIQKQDEAVLEEVKNARSRVQSRYVLAEHMGLVDPDDKLKADFEFAAKTKVAGSGEFLKQLAAKRRILKHVAKFGNWDRERFGPNISKQLTEEWQQFTHEVFNKLCDQHGRFLPISQLDEQVQEVQEEVVDVPVEEHGIDDELSALFD